MGQMAGGLRVEGEDPDADLDHSFCIRFIPLSMDESKMKTEPNPAPEPTPTTVTPPAGQEARQP